VSRPGERQGNLFGPSLNPCLRLKGALRQAVKESSYSREQIVERLNERARLEGLGGRRTQKLTLAALDGWLAESKETLPPVELLPLLCWATESLLPWRVLVSCNGAEVISGEERVLMELARVDREAKCLARKRVRLSQQLEDKS
jgi:hypothetical protein